MKKILYITVLIGIMSLFLASSSKKDSDSSSSSSSDDVTAASGSGDIDDFAVIMLAAQHLEAWKRFFLYENIEELPPLSYILERLFD